ncbi:pilin [Streptomyces endophyticus]|uniref:Pilin n=1 Tax=Streptomyces endophyticus TaxID=714166 RepID=A0ABU6F1Y8_9ACTN|nr:pilin [Streptomyces endophyticus]MEB8338019.1 pilin [Streptomyces endophyticus]
MTKVLLQLPFWFRPFAGSPDSVRSSSIQSATESDGVRSDTAESDAVRSESGSDPRRRRSGPRRGVRLLVAVAVLSVVCAAYGASAYAAGPDSYLALAKSVNEILDNIRNWIMGILAGLATVFLTVGGVRYVMAGGDPGEVEKAKTAFKSAGWGYGLAALAPLVVEILKGIVGN